MNVLLLTDMPPCKNFPTGLEIDRLCRVFSRGTVSCFAIHSPFVEPTTSADLDWMPASRCVNRNEYAYRPFPGPRSLPIAWAVESWHRRFSVPRLAARAIAFGRDQRADLVWAVLRGQTLIQIASAVARGIGAPMVTHVGAAPLPSLLEYQLDRLNRHAALSDFDRAITASRACVTATEAMAAAYQKQYGIPCVPLHLDASEDWGELPNLDNFPQEIIEIGVSAIADAPDEWLQLLRALNFSGWKVRGRQVRVNVIGTAIAPGQAEPGHIRHFGWRSPSETVEILSRLDVLYFPVPFAGGAAGLTFPRSFSQHLAAGRPILLHGPEAAAASQYLRRSAAGCVVADDRAAAIYNALCRLVDNPSEYRRLGEAAGQAFRRDFTRSAAQSGLQRVLDLAATDGSAK